MNCVPDELKVYLNKRELVTSYKMSVTADGYITHKKEIRGDLMGQVGTKSELNPYSEIRGDNRGIKGTHPSYNERPLMRKEKPTHGLLPLRETRTHGVTMSVRQRPRNK